MAKDERTLQFMENYKKLHEQGLSMKQIVDTYGLSLSRGYALLDEIATMHGVTRESLLAEPHPGYPADRQMKRQISPPADFDDFCERLVDLEAELGGLTSEMKEFLKKFTERVGV